MELQSIACELGLERLQTETTFVKDEVLKRHCQQFDQDLEKEKFFEQARPDYLVEMEMEHSIKNSKRGSLPSGSNLFQQAMLEYLRILRDEEEEKERIRKMEEEKMEDDDDIVKDDFSVNTNNDGILEKKRNTRKTSLVYPPKRQPVLRRLYSVQLDKYSIPAQSFGHQKRQ